jgi:AcrR family transcriptional regulator
MARDRQATERKILRAVGRILAEKGFQKFGINAVARQARVDKVLIYRYFGGMPDLLRAYSEAGSYWPTIEEVAGGDPERLRGEPLPDAVAALLCNFARAIRKRPVTLEILAWETIERNELTKVLEKVRKEFTSDLYRVIFTGRGRAAGADDMAAVVTLVRAGINYLAVRSRKVPSYGDVDIRSEEGWQRLESAIRTICGRCIATEKAA